MSKTYEYKGNRYETWEDENDVHKLKLPSGEWVECISYRPMHKWVRESDGKVDYWYDWNTLYVREKQDFLNKFKLVEDKKDETVSNH